MKLNELEEKLDVKFPKKFHEIYDMGVMEWITRDTDDYKAINEEFINKPEAFMFSLAADCEPCKLNDIPERYKELKEMLTWREEDEGQYLKEGSLMIPFAFTASGDHYCFFYENADSEPSIFLYDHDDYGAPVLWGENFDEFLYANMLSAADWEEDIDGEVWKCHLKYLSTEYREKLENKTADQLRDDFGEYSSVLDRKALKITIFDEKK